MDGDEPEDEEEDDEDDDEWEDVFAVGSGSSPAAADPAAAAAPTTGLGSLHSMGAGHVSKLRASTLGEDLDDCFVILRDEEFHRREAVPALKERLDCIESVRAKVDCADMAQGSPDTLVGIVDARILQHLSVLLELSL